MDVLNKKKVAALKAENNALERRLAETTLSLDQANGNYRSLDAKYCSAEESLKGKTAKVEELEGAAETAQGTIQALEARLRPVPNHEIITFQAIRELAGAKSDEGYDAFLKSMIGAVVDKGVTAYEHTLKHSLRGQQTYNDKFPMVMIPDGAGSYYAGFKVLDEVTQPAVDFIGMDFPFLDKMGYFNIIAERYGISEPQVVLRFRTQNDAYHVRSRTEEQDLLKNLLPPEWQAKLEADKKVLLQAFGFGLAASYYADVQAHPELPAMAINPSMSGTFAAPKRVLEVQERAGLLESQTLLQELYACLQSTHPRFSASVLGYFNPAGK